MKTRIIYFVAVGFAICSCSKGKNSRSLDEISGAYVREYSFKVINPENGNEIGIRTIRDTIFIRPVKNEYQISNNKWRLNDYDNAGWQSMEHAEDRSMHSGLTKFDNVDSVLRSKEEGTVVIYLDLIKARVFKSRHENLFYYKIREK